MGRPRGALNKITAEIKELVVGALMDVGGREYLAQQARANPVAFLALVGKVLPLQLTGAGGGPITVQMISYAQIEAEDAGVITITVDDADGE